MSGEDWSEWFIHDGKGCPVKGQYVWVVFNDGSEVQGIAGSGANEAIRDGFDPLVSWKWRLVPTENDYFYVSRIIRYRIRKPKGLTILESIAQGVREPEGV